MTSKMNAAIKEQWVAALRSGKYEQGHRRLNIDGKFCCLGVLCELAVEAGVATKSEPYMDMVLAGPAMLVTYDDGNTAYPSDKVAGWAGLSSPNPAVPDPRFAGEAIALSFLNDGGEWEGFVREPLTLLEIADLIEAHL